MNNRVGLLIFDCDGVLVDSEPVALRINLRLGRELGWPMDEEEMTRRFLGKSAPAIYRQMADRLGEETALLWERRFTEQLNAAIDTGLNAVAGVVEALDALGTLPLRTCIASSGSHEKMRRTLRAAGLYQRFEGRIYSATEVAEGKPAPDLFLYAARRMGVPPPDCVVIEDSQYGVQAARAAGMRSLGYAGGLTPAGWLTGPDTTVFDDMRKLPALLAAL
ncbi:HAD family hydrolase [Streptomyces aidingensis]|uniref:Haloacid dehalogenase superfamily, subfamily IA, variant 3 with third motif having DD or ED/haloacid dehalogenase superfamily, subfamily IA, variant 1 with third motif having Dx(3-4)D or Dx(3-4)E n=1 Tax=Streptomyces aidingensis TaxID=910347 RepID=A0A1I1UDW2_9ACTN|nr:HAD family phosphatase [Streptomyces aidingensis]SFD66963.1 haloacid dehalogenase superfamily, subfamily IA, variant 3 with third motif having DD or ED/haloacid dehalogenase superfamily, subfamily IA, variant 1 with third motif having Dx(3-4)D or Dx(3-4)E [Streptomyces aidingensis]